MEKSNNVDADVEALQKKLGKQKLRGIVYLRTNHWGDSTLAQQQLCENFRYQNNIEVVSEYADVGEHENPLGISESQGFSQVLSQCRDHKNGIDVVIVASRNRLGKNTVEYLSCKMALAKEGVDILSAADTETIDSSVGDIYWAINHSEEAV